MSKKIYLAQTVKELKFILNNTKEDLECVPLNLKVLLYCQINKIGYLNPISFLDNNFHKKSLEISEDFLNSVSFKKQYDYNIQIEYSGWLRFRLNSILFVVNVLEEIHKKHKIEKLYLSGWSQKNHNNLEGYFLIEMEELIRAKFNLRIISKNFINDKDSKYCAYSIKNIKSKKNKNILLNNLSYNFKRFILNKNRKNYNFFFINDREISILKKIIFYLLNVKPLNLEAKNIKKGSASIEYHIKNKEKFFFYNTIINMMKNFDAYFHNLKEKNLAIKDFLKNNKIDLIVSNIVRGFEGSAIEIGPKLNIQTVCVTHGTIAPDFNKYDKIYKKIIAEAVFSGGSQNFAIQSRICENALNTHKINGEKIISGNISFAQNKINKSKDYVIYAVTLKDFFNSQFYGVETFYEFNDNLKKLNEISLKSGIKVVVKVHPSHNYCVIDLKKIYKNLLFSTKSIETLLEKSFATISYSSTVIEDSLYSQVPVVLMDQWNRYKHCKSEKNLDIENKAVYYLNRFSDLEKCLNTIKSSNNINFSDYIYPGFYNENISNKILTLIK